MKLVWLEPSGHENSQYVLNKFFTMFANNMAMQNVDEMGIHLVTTLWINHGDVGSDGSKPMENK
jgi:hypothetical protein